MSAATLTIDTARIALILYVAALFVLIAGSDRRRPLARALWSAALVAYLAHVTAAFQIVHDWSHQAALAETARQTREMFGVDTGFGLWFNYLFTVVWAGDAAWWWIDEAGYRRRPAWVSIGMHAFLAFMFFNGAVVFADGPSRWIGLVALIVLALAWQRLRPGARMRTIRSE